MEEISQICSLVDQFITQKRSEKVWVPGKDWVQYSGPYFDASEYVAVVKSLLKEWLILGEDGIDFEKQFSKLLGKDFGVFVNSGSSANLLMMSALASKNLYGLPAGTKVITPIAGFPTTINPIFQVGFKPIFIDIELETLNLDLDQLESVAPHARAITFAHVLGNPPNMDRVMEIVKRHNLILLEDCCDALGSLYDGKLLGSFGQFASCSFFPAHHITTGEGGFVASQNAGNQLIIRNLAAWGRSCVCNSKQSSLSKVGVCGKRFSNWLSALPNEIFDHKYVYSEIGYNLKPIELQASIGLEQIKKLPEITRLRKRNHKLLSDIFAKYDDCFVLPVATPKSDPNWFAFALTVKDSANFKRKDIVSFLEDHRIQTRPYFAGNIMLQPAYEGFMNSEDVIKNYPVARKVTTDTFFLGVSPVITEEQIDYIGQTVDKFFLCHRK